MKLDIKEKEVRQPKKKLAIPLTVEQLNAKDCIDEWLASHAALQGEIPWDLHLEEKIEIEIGVRKKAEFKQLVNHKFVLPRDLVERMGTSDREYIEKGYTPDWDDRIRYFLDLMINTYAKQLEKILGEEAPIELLEYLRKKKKSKKTPRKNKHNDKDTGIGVSHGSS